MCWAPSKKMQSCGCGILLSVIERSWHSHGKQSCFISALKCQVVWFVAVAWDDPSGHNQIQVYRVEYRGHQSSEIKVEIPGSHVCSSAGVSAWNLSISWCIQEIGNYFKFQYISIELIASPKRCGKVCKNDHNFLVHWMNSSHFQSQEIEKEKYCTLTPYLCWGRCLTIPPSSANHGISHPFREKPSAAMLSPTPWIG